MAETKRIQNCNGEQCKDCPYCGKHEMLQMKSEVEELKKEIKRLKEVCGKLKILMTTDRNRWRYGLLFGIFLVATCSTIVDICMRVV